eukprot:COSAG01_NODE_64286_length_277_cov_0.578652_1_plen_53_part_10
MFLAERGTLHNCPPPILATGSSCLALGKQSTLTRHLPPSPLTPLRPPLAGRTA